MNQIELNADMLLRILEDITTASSDAECAEAVVFASKLIQDSVISSSDPSGVLEMLNEASAYYPDAVHNVISRAVDFHVTEQGDSYGLWLIPVLVRHNLSLPSNIQLTTKGLSQVKVAGSLSSQLNLKGQTEAITAKNIPNLGWVYSLPTLYSDRSLRQAPLSSLISLPVLARAYVHGTVSHFKMNGLEGELESEGTSLYYIPFVAKHPNGTLAEGVEYDGKTEAAVRSWVQTSLKDSGFTTEIEFEVLARPLPYSLAMTSGPRVLLEEKVKDQIEALVYQTKVAPGALSVLLSPYEVVNEDSAPLVAASISSRLTGKPLGLLSFSIHGGGAGDIELAIIAKAIRESGVEDLATSVNSKSTFSCQRCSHVQIQMPVPTPFEFSEAPGIH